MDQLGTETDTLTACRLKTDSVVPIAQIHPIHLLQKEISMTEPKNKAVHAQTAYEAIKMVAIDQLGLSDTTVPELRAVLVIAREYNPRPCGFIIVHTTNPPTLFLWYKESVPQHLPLWQHGVLKSPPDVSYFWYDGTAIQSVEKSTFFQLIGHLRNP